MGNLCSLFTPPKPVKKKRPITKRQSSSTGSGLNSDRWNRVRSSSSRRDNRFEDAVIQEHALAAAAVLFRQQNGGGSLPFDRSASQRYSGSSGLKKNGQLPRSSSTRSRSSTDPLLQPHQFLNQVLDS